MLVSKTSERLMEDIKDITQFGDKIELINGETVDLEKYDRVIGHDTYYILNRKSNGVHEQMVIPNSSVLYKKTFKKE